MKQLFEKMVNRIARYSNWQIVIGGAVILLIMNVVTSRFARAITGYAIRNGIEKNELANNWAFLIIGAPILETIFFQYLLLHYFRKIFPDWISVVLAAMIFGATHNYNPAYIVVTTIIGLGFNSIFYAVWIGKNSLGMALICVSLIHMIINGTVFAIIKL